MPIDRNGLESMSYWHALPERVSQRLYTSLCLFTASAQDSYLAEYESERSNRTWSASCAYYSLVHAGRFLSYLAFGDFPMAHEDLRVLFSAQPEQGITSREGNLRLRFDWLYHIRVLVGDDNLGQLRPRNQLDSQPEYWEELLSYFEGLNLVDARLRLTRFGRVLAAAAPLRNDSNYQALLIAHEFDHDFMTERFETMARLLQRGSQSTLELLKDALEAYVTADEELRPRRREYFGFVREVLYGRLIPAISEKLSGHSVLTKRLLSFLSGFLEGPGLSHCPEIHEHVARQRFPVKSALMTNFNRKVEALAAAVGVPQVG